MQVKPALNKSAAGSVPPSDSKLLAFRLLAVLLVLLMAETVVIGILWKRWRTALEVVNGNATAALRPSPNINYIKEAYPDVEFSQIYPGHTAIEIDLVQRNAYELTYRYEPFTGFGISPTNRTVVKVTPAGFRAGAREQPWPPDSESLNVFVFGGSTAFGYVVQARDALPTALEDELRRIYPGNRIECYNFGCGFYFSTQERLRFEQLLADGHVPKLAIFLDGLNDFYCAHGLPEFSSRVARVFPGGEPIAAPDITNGEQARSLVDQMLRRYEANTRMIEGLARQWQVDVIFVGQPIPFHQFPRTINTYPFPLPTAYHGLAMIGYDRFHDRAKAGRFGSSFIWCGDAFSDAKSFMYADGIHYSPEGNRVLAKVIVERAKERGLLKF